MSILCSKSFALKTPTRTYLGLESRKAAVLNWCQLSQEKESMETFAALGTNAFDLYQYSNFFGSDLRMPQAMMPRSQGHFFALHEKCCLTLALIFVVLGKLFLRPPPTR